MEHSAFGVTGDLESIPMASMFSSNHIALESHPFIPLLSAAVRYTMPGTLEQKVVNISGTRRDNLVTFYTPEEYLFENTDTGDQGGIWNRNIVSVRIEEAEPWQIEDMDYYFRKLYRKNHLEQTAKFSIIFSPIYNLVRWLCSFSDIAVRGNCAYFTSSVRTLQVGVLWKSMGSHSFL